MNTPLRQAVFNIMQRPKINIVVGLLFLAAVLQTPSAAQGGPGAGPSSGLPLSVQGDGLIRTPDPMDRISDLAITGNVRGGKYFRGSVPYRASTSFGRTTPSSSLDSFVRDSSGAEDISRFSSRYKPYYSPTQTVTTTKPGSSKVVRPPTMNIGGYEAQASVSGALSSRVADTAPDIGYIIPFRRSRPMSMTIPELEEQISSEIGIDLQPERPTEQQYRALADKFKRATAERIGEKAPELRELAAKDSPLMPQIERKLPDYTKEQAKEQEAEAPAQKGRADEDDKERPETPYTDLWSAEEQPPEEQQPKEQLDVYEQMKQQLDELQKRIDLALAEGKTEEQTRDDFGSLPGIADTNTSRGYKMPQRGLYTPEIAEIDPSITKKAKNILGPYHTFASFSESKFDKHMAAAELYLEQGRYYRAADAYTLASIYKPEDPLPYAGKSHALFASGEYVSSALFLSRALDMFPEYAQFKIDIVAMTGGSENLEARIADVEEWLSKSDAPELHFLLAYVYYQMNETDRAQKAINAAYEKTSETPAVLTLKKAIEGGI